MLRLVSVTKVFNEGSVNEKRALCGVDLSLAPGDFTTVIGSNGAGKSTMLNAIAGSFPLEQGQVFVGGDDVTGLSSHTRAGFIGRVFQDPLLGTAPALTIEENLSIARKRGQARGLRIAIDNAQKSCMEEELSFFGLDLESRLKTPAGSLSGGQRQALALLMAISARPRLLLLDEHTAALDPKTGAKVLQLTQDLVESCGLTTLMVTHNIGDSLRMGNRTVMMHEGRIILDIKGEERKKMTSRDVLRLFETDDGESRLSDRFLLSKQAVN